MVAHAVTTKKFTKFLVGILIAVLYVVTSSYCVLARQPILDPEIIIVSTGPTYWNEKGENIGFKVIVTMSEVYLNIFIQKLEYGEENCCIKVVKTYNLSGVQKVLSSNLFRVDDLSWVENNSFQFKGNSALYKVTILNGEVKIE